MRGAFLYFLTPKTMFSMYMTKNEIIEQWFREGLVQNIVKKVSNGSDDQKWDDLVQIVYIYLLEKPEELIQKIYKDGSYRYLAARMVMRQVTSTRSKWYYDTRRFWAYSLGDEIPEYTNAKNPSEEELIELYNDIKPLLTEEERELIDVYIIFGSTGEVAKAKFGEGVNLHSAEVQALRRKYKKAFNRLRLIRASQEKGWKPTALRGKKPKNEEPD